ncbi:TlpA family protein disulfide reductase [Microbulbifer salipaludis]|uniref:TlpA family protein disulfide reductase n=1 Tax=Microbulbifer salipaludis TaxID=187980 RepID=A0ABS3E6W8_9GAMM|nr:TlpA disulfide reductase family protein [Microbulbifer salipaludis]MBN8431061.1 TlpA family protein disulfide reductase [Microbulbifer salipaludis]
MSLILLFASGCEQRAGGLQSLEGGTLPTEGRILLVNYWAEWCAPCREEIPELNRFYQEHKADVLVLGINFDRLPVEQVRRQAERFGIEFPLLAGAPADHWGQPVPQVLPSTLIIDANGQWQGTLVGPQTAETLAEAIQATRRAAQ